LRRLLRRLGLALIAAPVFYILAGFLGAVLPGAVADVGGAPTERIALARGPIHYDILLPLNPETRAAFGFARAAGLPVDHRAAEWLVLGWGAEGFYTTVGAYADVTPSVLWRAVTGDAAVMRLDLAGDVSGVSGLDWLDVSPAQIAALRQVALAALERDADGRPLALPAAPWGQSHVFFRAKGRFNLFHTCNAWAGEALRAAGIRFGLWTPTTQAVSLSLRWNRP
jgi:uncharacterized protein (TIGR02117 family)